MADDDVRDRAAILARRKRFITAALAGLAGIAGTSLATACPCLDVPPPNEPDSKPGEAPADPAAEAKADAKTDAPQDTAPAEPAKAGPPQR